MAAVLCEGARQLEHAINQKIDEHREEEKKRKPSPIPYPGDDPTKPPGEGWKWKGRGEPGSGEGSWFNEKTRESFYPDLDHAPPIGPHWDYGHGKGDDRKDWRVYPDNTYEIK